jgi:undecaprenyl-diphosphatase
MYPITIPEALFLGLVQGFTEWLPISSSGHLVIFQSLLGITVPPEFDIVIMMGTIAALILYLRKKILLLLGGLFALERKTLNYVGLIVLSGIPTGIIGFAGKEFFKGLFSQPFVVSLLLIVTGIFLFIASRPKNQKDEVGVKSALWMGVAQGCAVAPGISRSGATIGTALLLGVERRAAAEFSFLIGIPAMTIAAVLTFLEEPSAGTGFAPLLVGIVAAFIAGYASIGLFMKWLQEDRNHCAVYCVMAGSVLLRSFAPGILHRGRRQDLLKYFRGTCLVETVWHSFRSIPEPLKLSRYDLSSPPNLSGVWWKKVSKHYQSFKTAARAFHRNDGSIASNVREIPTFLLSNPMDPHFKYLSEAWQGINVSAFTSIKRNPAKWIITEGT